MLDKNFQEGTTIKGKDLKDYTLCKILSEDMVMRGFQYRTGMNEDVNALAVKGNRKAGLHFSLVQNICEYLCFGTKLAVVSIPDGEDVYVDGGKFRTHRLYIEKVMLLNETVAWEYLYENGADITADDNYAVRWASENGYLEVVKFLHENGADITARNNYAVKWAAMNGFLDAVKYLHKNGADIRSCDNYAVRWAAVNGFFDIVKYLHENGADITAGADFTIKMAEKNGHMEIIEYLKEHMG